MDEGGDNMEEIIVIRAIDPDENVFQTIMDALHGKSVQVIEATSSMLSFGDVKIYPAYRRVLKAGEAIHLNHGEYSMDIEMAGPQTIIFWYLIRPIMAAVQQGEIQLWQMRFPGTPKRECWNCV